MTRPHLSGSAAIAILAVATVLFRLPSLFPEQIDWDEWSFILMGADVAQGHLPFVHQFDLKPPLVFFLFGGTIALFGKSLLAIRLLGTLSVLAAATFVFLLGRRVANPAAVLGGALMFAALTSAPFGLATSSELPAIAFLTASVWSLSHPTRPRAALAGLLVALAVLTRTNLALVALALGALLLVAAMFRHAPRFAWLAYGMAGLVPPLLLVLVYVAIGEIATLKLAMIDVPLAYSGQLGIVEVAREHLSQLYYTAQTAPWLYLPPALLAVAGTGLTALRHAPGDRWPLAVLLVATISTVGSLLIGGAAYPHYWLQVLPFVGVFVAIGITHLTSLNRWAGIAAGALAALPIASALATALIATPAAYTSPHPIAQAAAHIRAQTPRPTIWALHEHLIHWYLDAPQLSRAGVHPDNLARRAIIDTLAAHRYVGPDEIARLMALRPEYVVTDAAEGLAWVRAAGKPVDAWLAANYRQDARYGDVLVYRRR